MAKKRLKPFSATKAVKSAARTLVGPPPPTVAIPDKRRKQQEEGKHKRNMARLLEENQQ